MKKTLIILLLFILIPSGVFASSVSNNSTLCSSDTEEDPDEEDTDEEEDNTEKYTITYYCIDWYNPNPTEYTSDVGLNLLPATRLGYDFIGWYDVNRSRFITRIPKGTQGDLFLQVFSTEKEYTITYDANGGVFNAIPKRIFTINSDDFVLLQPYKEGYDFIGWVGSNGPDPEIEVTILQGSTEDRTYLAKYELHNYSIEYDLDGGYFKFDTPTDNLYSFTYLTDTFMLPNDTTENVQVCKEDCEFLGWSYDTEDEFPSSIISKTIYIQKGTMEDQAFKAIWKENAIEDDVIDETIDENTENEEIFDDEDEEEEETPATPKNTSFKMSTADAKYKSNSSENAVSITKIKDKMADQITVPTTVTYKGKKYKVTTICKNCFNQSAASDIILGRSVTTIETNAFKGCKNLKSITIKSKKLQTIDKNAFKGCKNITFYVPKGYKKKYKSLIKKSGLKNFKVKAIK